MSVGSCSRRKEYLPDDRRDVAAHTPVANPPLLSDLVVFALSPLCSDGVAVQQPVSF